MSKSFAQEFLQTFDDFKLPLELSDRFEVIECFAKSDYGETYLLSEKDSGKWYVLKCCKKTDTLSAVHEAELLKDLAHKGLPRFEMEVEEEDTLFLLREYIVGISLDKYLAENTPDEMQVTNIIISLCDILSYLHSQTPPIIHRDIKLSNIIIDTGDNNAVFLIDFGISRKYSKEAGMDTVCFGTQGFAPPEQFGFSQTDWRADIYSLGIVFRYLLTGTADPKATIKNKKLSQIAAKCTEFSPDTRYQNVDAIKKAIKKARRRTKQKLLIITSIVLGVCLAFGAGFMAGRYTDVLAVKAIESDSDIVTFSEPLIEEAVRRMLGKKEGEPVLVDELENIFELYFVAQKPAASNEEYNTLRNEFHTSGLPYGNLKNIDDLQKMNNLSRLCIFGQNLSDISALSTCLRLEEVEIMHCQVQDFSPLTKPFRIKTVNIYDNPLDDFTIFTRMPSLACLTVADCSLQNISELGDIKNIEELVLERTKIISLEGIKEFSRLKRLKVSYTLIRDFSLLNELPYLEKFSISSDMEEYLDTFNRPDVELEIVAY